MTNEAVPMSIGGKLGYVYQAARAEHKSIAWSERATLVGALGGLAFEWGTGNEALLGTVGGNIHRITENPAITGLASGAASFAEQGLIGTMMALTIHNFPKVTTALREVVARDETADRKASKMGRFASVMILGSAVELIKENAVRQNTRRQNIKRALGSSAIIASANTALIGGASAGLVLGAEHGFETQAETTVAVISNPLTYVALLGGSIGYSKIRKYFQKHRLQKDSLPQPALEEVSEGTK